MWGSIWKKSSPSSTTLTSRKTPEKPESNFRRYCAQSTNERKRLQQPLVKRVRGFIIKQRKSKWLKTFEGSMNFLVNVVLTNDDQFTTFVYPYRTATVHNTMHAHGHASMQHLSALSPSHWNTWYSVIGWDK